MRLDDIRPSVESSGGMKEEFFSIEDQGMIFDILRNKMYSNPIKAICREISCNARDAHREVGTPERPIQITIPTDLEPYFKVKDWGPGISPDRMSNIFIRYAASTKRSDNLQTGGFGLGAKTPFSYSDTFTILTTHNGIEYNYACFIDETKVGKLALLSSFPTDKVNGTEIIIPVNKYNDYFAFKDSIYLSTKHWNVKPIIKGGVISYNKNDPVISGNGWAMYNDGWDRETKIIIDGIEYPIDATEFRKFADKRIIDNCCVKICLYFNVGELTLAANREQLYFDDKTRTAIINRMIDIREEIRSEIQLKIDNISNLLDAQIFLVKSLNNCFYNLDFLGDLTWKGINLFKCNKGFVIGCPVFTYSRSPYGKIRRTNNYSKICFDSDLVLFVNDLDIEEPTPKYFKKFFEENSNVKLVVLICPNSSKTEAQLNDEIHLDMMNPNRLSSIASYKKRSFKSRLIVFKFDKISKNFRQIKIDKFDDSNKKKILVRLQKDKFNPSTKSIVCNKYSVNLNIIKELQLAFSNVEFYGVDVEVDDARVKESFPNCENYDDFVYDNVINLGVDFKMVKAVAGGLSCGYEYSSINLDCLSPLEGYINDPDSVFIRVCAALKMLNTISNDNKYIFNVYESIIGYIPSYDIEDYLKDNPHMFARTYLNELMEKYPMIKFLSGSTICDSISYLSNSNSIADYINLVDKG